MTKRTKWERLIRTSVRAKHLPVPGLVFRGPREEWLRLRKRRMPFITGGAILGRERLCYSWRWRATNPRLNTKDKENSVAFDRMVVRRIRAWGETHPRIPFFFIRDIARQ